MNIDSERWETISVNFTCEKGLQYPLSIYALRSNSNAPDRPLVVMCAGTANDVSVYNFLGDYSLPYYLGFSTATDQDVDNGCDVFLINLRGRDRRSYKSSNLRNVRVVDPSSARVDEGHDDDIDAFDIDVRLDRLGNAGQAAEDEEDDEVSYYSANSDGENHTEWEGDLEAGEGGEEEGEGHEEGASWRCAGDEQTSDNARHVPKMKKRWGVYNYVFEDALFCIEHILEITGRRRCHFVGHSMGGMVGLSLAAHPLTFDLFHSVTALSSALFLENTYWSFLVPLLPILQPFGGLNLNKHLANTSNLLQSASSILPSMGFEQIIGSSRNMGFDAIHQVMQRCFVFEPYEVIETLANTISNPCGLTFETPLGRLHDLANSRRKRSRLLSRGRQPASSSSSALPEEEMLRNFALSDCSYMASERRAGEGDDKVVFEVSRFLGRYFRRVLFINGADDVIIKHVDVQRTYDCMCANIEEMNEGGLRIDGAPLLSTFGKGAYPPADIGSFFSSVFSNSADSDATEYCHFDTILGKAGPEEVFPLVKNFIIGNNRPE